MNHDDLADTNGGSAVNHDDLADTNGGSAVNHDDLADTNGGSAVNHDDLADTNGGSAVNHDDLADTNGPAGSERPDPGKVVLAVNGVIAAVGGTYASTHSLAATVVAGCAGLACAALLVWKR